VSAWDNRALWIKYSAGNTTHRWLGCQAYANKERS
jgi:hypothetical protein